ncbi:MAG: hypothetical protein A2W35_13520 [Chloroflexi bacterium RBG_16_57_11]|nr:MAG: hypothetical protein A2W35_13520 [Chloroflexi bacterium RBG_16_57_11]
MNARYADRRVLWGRKALRPYDETSGFRCIHCQRHVSTARSQSGVWNRNHCPYCLHSRHLDWQRAGDRLAACKGGMHPVSLTFKQVNKRYGAAIGELMIVHHCTDCGKLSINRIAADDDHESILEIYLHSQRLEPRVLAEIEAAGIQTITAADFNRVLSQLFGKN